MNAARYIFIVIAFLFFNRLYYAQTGWIQTQLNSTLGYSLTVIDSEIFASTANGAYSTTSDGMPWFSRGPERRGVFDIIQIHAFILAATDSGVFRSSDKGNTWQHSEGSPSIYGSGGVIGPNHFAKNSTSVFIISWAAGIYRSDDDGLTWNLLTVGSDGPGFQDYAASATCIESIGEKIIFGRAEDHPFPVYMTSDNGNTWTGSKIELNDGYTDQLLCFYNYQGKLLAGGFRGVYSSTDSGGNWSVVYKNTINDAGQVKGLGIFRSIISYNQYLIAAVDFNSLQISGDEGKTWTGFNDGIISDWSFANLAINPPYIWALTNFFGNAYRRNLNEIVTEIESGQSNLPAGYLLLQAYPNPFNPETTIKFSISDADTRHGILQQVQLKIYDALGREVAFLVNEEKVSGNYSVKFNAQDLPSGIYFCNLKSGSFRQTIKIVLMK